MLLSKLIKRPSDGRAKAMDKALKPVKLPISKIFLTLEILTSDPTVKLWGNSVAIVTASEPFHSAPAINLKFLCWLTDDNDPVP